MRLLVLNLLLSIIWNLRLFYLFWAGCRPWRSGTQKKNVILKYSTRESKDKNGGWTWRPVVELQQRSGEHGHPLRLSCETKVNENQGPRDSIHLLVRSTARGIYIPLWEEHFSCQHFKNLTPKSPACCIRRLSRYAYFDTASSSFRHPQFWSTVVEPLRLFRPCWRSSWRGGASRLRSTPCGLNSSQRTGARGATRPRRSSTWRPANWSYSWRTWARTWTSCINV